MQKTEKDGGVEPAPVLQTPQSQSVVSRRVELLEGFQREQHNISQPGYLMLEVYMTTRIRDALLPSVGVVEGKLYGRSASSGSSHFYIDYCKELNIKGNAGTDIYG